MTAWALARLVFVAGFAAAAPLRQPERAVAVVPLDSAAAALDPRAAAGAAAEAPALAQPLPALAAAIAPAPAAPSAAAGVETGEGAQAPEAAPFVDFDHAGSRAPGSVGDYIRPGRVYETLGVRRWIRWRQSFKDPGIHLRDEIVSGSIGGGTERELRERLAVGRRVVRAHLLGLSSGVLLLSFLGVDAWAGVAFGKPLAAAAAGSLFAAVGAYWTVAHVYPLLAQRYIRLRIEGLLRRRAGG